MKNIGGVWLPDHEKHLVEWMEHPKNRELVGGKLAYQWKKQQAAMALVRQFRTVVDVGAHCGLWSMHLAKRFSVLHAFEPVADHRACWQRNVDVTDRTVLHAVALGAAEGSCTIATTPTSSGDSYITGAGEILIKRLDDFQLQDVDFIKLDCEGYELLALRGGEETLKRWRPAVVVEQKPGRAQKYGLAETGAVAYLEGLGAKLRQVISGDYFLSWDAQ